MLLHHSVLDELLFILLERLCCALLKRAHKAPTLISQSIKFKITHNNPSKSLQLPHPFPGNLGMGSRDNAPDYFVIQKQYHNDELQPIRVPEPCYCTL